MAEARKRDDTGTLGKAMSILELVTASHAPLRFTDILALSGQPRGTLHRQLTHLLAEGLLELKPDHCYVPGLRLLKFASAAWASSDFRNVAAPHLRRLHDLTGETVHLGLLRETEIVYLDKVESRQAVRMNSQIGNASPVYCTGVGKAVLSVLSQGELDALLARIEFRRFTPETLADRGSLLADIDTVRERGHAFDREEHEAGIRCVAAPVHDRGCAIFAGVSVTGPAYRVGMDRLEAWAPLVREVAAAIVAEIPARLGPQRQAEP